MTIYLMLATMSGIVILEGVALGIMNASRNRAVRSAFAQIGEFAGFINNRLLPMFGLALWGGVLLKLGETLPFGSLLQLGGAASFSLSLVVLLNYFTSDSL
jgi:hypothetical protein